MTITLVQSKNTTNSSMYYRILNHICVHVCTLKDEDGKQLDISVPCPLSKGGFLDFLSSFPLSVQSLSCVQLFATPWIAACLASLPFTNSQNLAKFLSIQSVMPSNHPILSSPSLPTFNPSQHQGLFQLVSSSHQAAKLLELQLQHQSFQ